MHVHRDQASRPDESEALAYRRVAIRLVAVVSPVAVHGGNVIAGPHVILGLMALNVCFRR